MGRGRFAANVLSKRVVTLVPSQKATKKQKGKCYVLTPQRYVGAEAEALEEEGLDEKRLHLTAKWEKKLGLWRSSFARGACTNSLGAESPHSGGCEVSC